MARRAASIHEAGGIHRDIKTENIFVARSGNLVLGDFGIVFFREGGRVTSTFERVGSHYWMAPWAYKNQRLTLDEMNFKLDIYPLGKVLWSMVSGHDGFLREEFRVDDNDLTKLFPNDPAMPLINDLLDQCVVRNEKECLFQNALDLRLAIDGLHRLSLGRRGVLRLRGGDRGRSGVWLGPAELLHLCEDSPGGGGRVFEFLARGDARQVVPDLYCRGCRVILQRGRPPKWDVSVSQPQGALLVDGAPAGKPLRQSPLNGLLRFPRPRTIGAGFVK